jgi:lia operon protein LiaG
MKTNFKISTLLLFILSVAAISPALAQVKTLVDVTKSFSGISKIEISGGQLEVEYIGGPKSDVSVNAFLESSNADQDIVFVTLGDVLKISHKVTNNNNWNNKTKGHIKITGPVGISLDMKGGSGSVYVENVNSEKTNIAVGSGSVSAKNIRGDVFASAGSGSIKMEGIDGNVKGQVGSGSAKMEDIKGNINYSSGSGGISVAGVEGIVNVSLSSGNAKLENVSELGDLKVTSGNVSAINAGLGTKTRLSGTSGNFKIQTTSNLRDFNYNLNATSGNVTVGNSRGGRNLNIDNGANTEIRGSITSGNISIVNQ